MAGRPRKDEEEILRNYKAIKLNDAQVEKWDCDEVRGFIDLGMSVDDIKTILELIKREALQAFPDKMTEDEKELWASL